MKKKYFFAFLLSVFIAASVFSFAKAEDDEEDDDYESSGSTVSNSGSVKMVTETIIIEPAKIVTSTIMKDVLLADSDRDGIPDEQDIYPQIPQQFIVSDLNLDGIDDNLELQN